MARKKVAPTKESAKVAPSEGETGPPAGELNARLGGVPLENLIMTVRGAVNIELDEPEEGDVEGAEFRVDNDEWVHLKRRGGVWRGDLHTEGLSDGQYQLEIKAQRRGGSEEVLRADFRVRNRLL